MSSWDVIVIGTGIGGGTLGRQLAEAGLRVLFLEKGRTGYRRDVAPMDTQMFEPTGRAVRGLWPAPMQACIDGRDSTFFGPIGCGLGGSSVFYAATLERPERHDVDDSAARPHPTGGWPVSFDDLAPHFARAERMYRICGTHDPLSSEPAADLRTPPSLSDVDHSFMQSFAASGLHPYRAHSAMTYEPRCQNCLGHKCPRPCKMDGRSAGVEPALATGRATLRDQAEVTRITPMPEGGAEVQVRRLGQTEVYAASHVVLAAGAFGSARLFMASDLPDRGQLAGRNLMFHLNEMIALWPKDKSAEGGSKAISLRDLYHREGQRFGTVQSMGIDVGYGEIVHFLTGMLTRSPFARLPGRHLATRLVAAIAARLFGRAQVFVGLLEDLPYAENRVLPSGDDTLAFQYSLHPELRQRRRAFRRAMRQAFRGHRKWFLSLQPELNYGHPCGTLRMGTDPERSVVDPRGAVHGAPGVWVADASLFPTSMGVNPSLSIAALALHVGTAILSDLQVEDRI